MRETILSKQLLHSGPTVGRLPCRCGTQHGPCSLIAITGGPGAGKTAILNLAQNLVCQHVALVPESATVLFSGGFWRTTSSSGVAATQKAIYHVQRQLESILLEAGQSRFGLCDRGTIDGAAYWPLDQGDYWQAMGTTREAELARYMAVIHLRSPIASGYNHSNPQRLETVEQAALVDEAILHAWRGHPNRIVIESEASFAAKVTRTMAAIEDLIPRECRTEAR